jgi:prepilin-type N-terminal cleavage/methylation domain-containing protein
MGRGGFTLIEVVAAVFLTSIVLAVAIGFFVNLSRSTEAATNRSREGRYALAALDRLARDFEGASLLVAPEGEDPFYHAWQFLAESHHASDGSDRVKFVTRNHRPRSPRDHGSDLAVVTYLLREGEEEPGYELVRAVEPGLPEAFEREFLRDDDELFMVVAERIDQFSMRFLGGEGAGQDWQTSWDSTGLEQANTLPGAVEIRLAYIGLFEDAAQPGAEDFDDFLDDPFDEEGDSEGSFVRHVVLPMRAIDLDAMLAEAEETSGGSGNDGDDAEDGEDDDGEGSDEKQGETRTVGDCLSPERRAEAVERFGDILNTELTDELAETLASAGYPCQ